MSWIPFKDTAYMKTPGAFGNMALDLESRFVELKINDELITSMYQLHKWEETAGRRPRENEILVMWKV